MKTRLSDKDMIKCLNVMTHNIYNILDSMPIRKSNDKLSDYIEFLERNTKVSKNKIKKLLTYDTRKSIPLKDLHQVALALGVTLADLFRIEFDNK